MSKRLSRDFKKKYLSGRRKRGIDKAKKADTEKDKCLLNKYFSKSIFENKEQAESQHKEDETEESQLEEITHDKMEIYLLKALDFTNKETYLLIQILIYLK